jgi:hypothetical protein
VTCESGGGSPVFAYPGFRERLKTLTNLPSTWAAIWSKSAHAVQKIIGLSNFEDTR